jgi:flagellar basal-body rod protein FlgF
VDPAYYVAAGSLKARSFQLDMLSNNLANSATVGYKPEKTFFSIFNKAKSEGRGLALSPYVNDGTVIAQSGTDFGQGTLRHTGRSLDLALEGNGFLQVKTPQGVQLTRDGRLQLGKDGQLETLDGYPVLGNNGLPISIDSSKGDLTFQADGTIEQAKEVVGNLGLKAYADPTSLTRVGGNRFVPGSAKEAAAGATVTQGSLEQSGVDLATCMIDMIRLQRLFEMSMKAASTVTNDMDERSITDISTGR